MKAIYPFLILSFFLTCISMPKIEPVDKAKKQEILNNCRSPFQANKYRFIHSIHAKMPTGDKTTVIGITIADPDKRTIQCVIMTIEGLVLFDAIYAETLVINRCIPPFDSKDFARGLMEDINLIFFPPAAKIESYGKRDNRYVCRYEESNRRIEDIEVNTDRSWTIFQYDTSYSKRRTVNGYSINKNGIAEKIDLIAYGLFGYELNLELVSAEPVSARE